ncbi:HAD family hydrolase [Dankookia sp. P2]|uniref:HAD family hydrolase n=1 Tax=Dankookia sp. P2 TaxID=3423955 RepID=UPI003D66A0BF
MIAFDIFDTLLRRTITPEHVKRLSLDRLARRLALPVDAAALWHALRHRIEAELCRANADRHGELGSRFDDLAREIHAELRTAGTAGLPEDVAGFAAALLACEMAVEAEVLEPVPEAVAALDQLRQRGRRIVVVSDFYLPETQLRRLLDGCGIALGDLPLFVSCDRMASKRSGRLYPVVLQGLGIRPADLLMVGDNPHSDGAMALAAGCRSLLLDAGAQHGFYARPEAGPPRRPSPASPWTPRYLDGGVRWRRRAWCCSSSDSTPRRGATASGSCSSWRGKVSRCCACSSTTRTCSASPDRTASPATTFWPRAGPASSPRSGRCRRRISSACSGSTRRISLGESLASLRILDDAAARMAAELWHHAGPRGGRFPDQRVLRPAARAARLHRQLRGAAADAAGQPASLCRDSAPTWRGTVWLWSMLAGRAPFRTSSPPRLDRRWPCGATT